MKCRVSLDELRHDMQNDSLMRKVGIAQDRAIKLLNNGDFDADTYHQAMKSLDREEWKKLIEMLANDYCSAGRMIREKIYDQLVKEVLGDE